MNTDIRDYARVYKGFLDQDTCITAINQSKNVMFKQHTFYNHERGEHSPMSGDQELDVFTDNKFDVDISRLIIDKLTFNLKSQKILKKNKIKWLQFIGKISSKCIAHQIIC